MHLIRYQELTWNLIAYKRLLGLTTSKTSVNTPALCLFTNTPQTHRFLDQSKGEDYVDENGIRTIIEYAVNEEGKKVKVRRGFSTSSALLILRPDYKKNQANSAKVAGGARRSGAKNMGQVWAREG
jgi:hypothetical protein